MVAKKSVKKSKKVISKGRKKDIVTGNIIVFAVLLILSLVLYSVSSKEIYENLFYLLSIIFGFITIAFVIVFLVFFFRKFLRKK